MCMNCFCGTVDQWKVLSLSRWDHWQRSSPSQISGMPGAGFEPAQNLSSGFGEWSCAVVITSKPQHLLYGLANASRYWYLHVKAELIKFCSSVSTAGPGILYCKENNTLTGTLACHVADMICGGNEKFGTNLEQIEWTFHAQYLAIKLMQDIDFSITIDQDSYIKNISKIYLPKERLKEKCSHYPVKKKHYTEVL